MTITLVLASASPARLRTLRAAGLDPEVIVSGVDESIVTSARPTALCSTLARLKAESVVARLRQRPPAGVAADTLVLGCDSVLEFDGEILGKPADEADATRRWHAMRGRSGTLHTGHCLIRPDAAGSTSANSTSASSASATMAEEVASTVVWFADASDAEVEAYVATGEPLHVAGAFTIDGLGGWFVDRLEGDAGTVIGVSLPVLRRLLAQVGVGVADLWPAPLTSHS